MKLKRKITTVLLTASALSLLPSCRHKDLYMEEDMTSRLQVVFDWRDAPDATPASMAMYLYENEGGNPMRFIFSNSTGGEIKAPFGTHHAICMNADINDWARMRNSENIETLEISTLDSESLPVQRIRSETVPRAEGTENERMATTPHMLWGSRLNNISIVPHEGTQTITLYPHECICYYTVDILDVTNLEGVESSAVDGSLSGMAEAYNHGADSPTDIPVTMTFTLIGDAAKKSLHGEFLTFGECSLTAQKHYLTAYMVLSDGSRWYKTFDVTDQVSKADDPRHVHIIVSGLELPQPPSEGSQSLTTDVNEWQSVNIGIQM